MYGSMQEAGTTRHHVLSLEQAVAAQQQSAQKEVCQGLSCVSCLY